MWGHRDVCACPICSSLRRIFQIIAEGTAVATFSGIASQQVRHLEGELRDILTYCRGQSPALPNAPVVSRPPAQEGAAPGAALGERPEGAPEAKGEETVISQPPKKEPADKPPATTAKTKPPEPPPPPPKVPLKVEENESPENLVDVEDLSAAASSKVKKRDKRRSRSRRRRRSDSDRRARSSRRSRSKSRRRRREKGSTRSPSEKKGKERKARSREVPLPRTPPVPPPRAPRSPSRPSPGFPVRQGPGWRGEIPYSSHPRWGGANKGIVKRAKQERYNQRQRR